MEKIWKLLGYIWALPLTLVGLTYTLIFTALGWYTWNGICDDALMWVVNQQEMPTWLYQRWLHWSGHSLGNVVVLKHGIDTNRGKIVLVHEIEHIHQSMRLGVFYPIAYAIIYVSIKVACESADAYIDHCFEVSARRRAGQVVDVIGALAKLKAEHKTVADLKR